MRVIPVDEAHDAAVAELSAGRPVIVPTDTVYGVAAPAGDADAVAELFRLKGRPDDVAIAVLVADTAQAETCVRFHDGDRALARAFWPGPLTLVCQRRAALSVGAADGTLGVRCPDSAFLRNLASAAGPLATTSANRHGEPPATSAESAARALGGESMLVVDGGDAAGVASTVVRSHPQLVVLRNGPVSRDDLWRIVSGAGRTAP